MWFTSRHDTQPSGSNGPWFAARASAVGMMLTMTGTGLVHGQSAWEWEPDEGYYEAPLDVPYAAPDRQPPLPPPPPQLSPSPPLPPPAYADGYEDLYTAPLAVPESGALFAAPNRADYGEYDDFELRVLDEDYYNEFWYGGYPRYGYGYEGYTYDYYDQATTRAFGDVYGDYYREHASDEDWRYADELEEWYEDEWFEDQWYD